MAPRIRSQPGMLPCLSVALFGSSRARVCTSKRAGSFDASEPPEGAVQNSALSTSDRCLCPPTDDQRCRSGSIRTRA